MKQSSIFAPGVPSIFFAQFSVPTGNPTGSHRGFFGSLLVNDRFITLNPTGSPRGWFGSLLMPGRGAMRPGS